MVKTYLNLPQWTTSNIDGLTCILSGVLTYNNTIITKSSELSDIISVVSAGNLFSVNWVEEFLAECDGDFALIIHNNESLILAADTIRSKPLFYFEESNSITVFDSLNGPDNAGSEKVIVHDYLEEFVVSGFIFGSKTLYKNILQVQAGEYLIYTNKKILKNRYFQYIPSGINNKATVPEFVNSFDTTLSAIFGNMVKSVHSDRKWVVPLSGGYDSRMVVNYLYKAGVKNVLCYGYGKEKNMQSVIAEKIARSLGYDWYFCVYTEKKWHELHEDNIIDRLIDYSFNGVSAAHLQDCLAVYEMKKIGKIREGDIFLPGHSIVSVEQALSGKDYIKDPAEAVRDIVNRLEYNIVKTGGNLIRDINEMLGESNVPAMYYLVYFEWQERQSKFIANSVRIYEFFGFDYKLPFWYSTFSRYYLSLSHDDRVDRHLLYRSLKEGILVDEIINIDFYDQLNPKRITNKDLLKKFIPISVKSLIIGVTPFKNKIDEATESIYYLAGMKVGEFMKSINGMPEKILKNFRPFMGRRMYQCNFHFITILFVLKKIYTRRI